MMLLFLANILILALITEGSVYKHGKNYRMKVYQDGLPKFKTAKRDPTDPWVRSLIADLVKARTDYYTEIQRLDEEDAREAELQRTGYAGLFG